jgi:hypothetical protein
LFSYCYGTVFMFYFSFDSPQACLLTKVLNEITVQDRETQQIISDNLSMLQQVLAETFELIKS